MLTVRCPACQAAYQIEADKLGAGRKLKCAKCGAIWLAKAEADEPPAAPAAAPAVDPGAPPPAPAAEKMREEQAPLAPGDEEFVSRMPTLDSVVEARAAGWAVWWQRHQWRAGALALVVAGLAMGVAVLRQGDDSDAAWAAQAGAEPVADDAAEDTIKPIQPPRGIVLRKVRSEIATTETGVLLTVRGLVTNTTSRTLVVPPLLLQLLDKDGTVQDMWPVSSVAGELPAKEENAWSVSLTEPTLEAVRGWRVVFTEPRQQGEEEGLATPVAAAASATQP